MRSGKENSLSMILPSLFTIAVTGLMVEVSVWIPEREVIFPEIAAIAVGALLSPHFTWNTDKKRILFYIMLCAAAGMGIVYLAPGPLWLQLIIAYAVSQIILSYSGTTFAPMVSAIVLPVMLQTRTPLYLASAFIFTSLILLLRMLLERIRIKGESLRKKDPYSRRPVPGTAEDWKFIGLKIGIASVVIIAAVMSGYPFIAAPPILVAFTEFANPGAKARRHPLKAVLLISLCAGIGAASRLVITMYAGLPLTLSAMIAITAAVILIHIFHMYLPPAGAMTVLAMLVPEKAVAFYPLCALLGVSVFMIAAKICFREPSY